MAAPARPLPELRRADLLIGAPANGPEPAGIGMDSRNIAQGQVYLAVRGSQADGHRFVADAVARGAAAVVVEQPQGSGVPEIVVRDGRLAGAVLLGDTGDALWYRDLIRSGAPISAMRDGLVFGRAFCELPQAEAA